MPVSFFVASNSNVTSASHVHSNRIERTTSSADLSAPIHRSAMQQPERPRTRSGSHGGDSGSSSVWSPLTASSRSLSSCSSESSEKRRRRRAWATSLQRKYLPRLRDDGAQEGRPSSKRRVRPGAESAGTTPTFTDPLPYTGPRRLSNIVESPAEWLGDDVENASHDDEGSTSMDTADMEARLEELEAEARRSSRLRSTKGKDAKIARRRAVKQQSSSTTSSAKSDLVVPLEDSLDDFIRREGSAELEPGTESRRASVGSKGSHPSLALTVTTGNNSGRSLEYSWSSFRTPRRSGSGSESERDSGYSSSDSSDAPGVDTAERQVQGTGSDGPHARLRHMSMGDLTVASWNSSSRVSYGGDAENGGSGGDDGDVDGGQHNRANGDDATDHGHRTSISTNESAHRAEAAAILAAAKAAALTTPEAGTLADSDRHMGGADAAAGLGSSDQYVRPQPPAVVGEYIIGLNDVVDRNDDRTDGIGTEDDGDNDDDGRQQLNPHDRLHHMPMDALSYDTSGWDSKDFDNIDEMGLGGNNQENNPDEENQQQEADQRRALVPGASALVSSAPEREHDEYPGVDIYEVEYAEDEEACGEGAARMGYGETFDLDGEEMSQENRSANRHVAQHWSQSDNYGAERLHRMSLDTIDTDGSSNATPMSAQETPQQPAIQLDPSGSLSYYEPDAPQQKFEEYGYEDDDDGYDGHDGYPHGESSYIEAKHSAKPLRSKKEPWFAYIYHHMWYFLLGTCVLLGTIILIVFLVRRDSGGSDSAVDTASQGDPTAPPRTNDDNSPSISRTPAEIRRKDTIQTKLVRMGISDASVFDDASSLQNMALEWLSFNDQAQLDPNDQYLPSRYSLAVFYMTAELAMNEKRRQQDLFEAPETSGQVNDWVDNSNWMSSAGFCSWSGIKCVPRWNNPDETKFDGDGEITHFVLPSNNIHTPLPAELFSAFGKSLRVLDLSDNKLTSSIPDEINELAKIETLDLSRNALTGRMPDMSSLKALQTLRLRSNELSGEISPLQELEALVAIDLQLNGFTGSFDLTKLQRAINLKEIRVNDNDGLTGVLPYQLGFFGFMSRVEILDLSRNSFDGTVPRAIRNMKGLVELNISGNLFTGELPDTLGDLYDLKILDISNNQFEGISMPSSVCELKDNHNLNELVADCRDDFGGGMNAKVFCPCCTECA